MSILSPATNGVMYPGLPFLGTNIERYIVNGGGATVFQLMQGDQVEVLDEEGLQKCEAIFFDEAGQRDASVAGLKPGQHDTALSEILTSQAPDVRRLRQSLEFRSCDLRDLKCNILLDGDHPAGVSEQFTAHRDGVCVLVAPGGAMSPDEQTPATDITVLVKRANPKAASDAFLPDPLGDPRLDFRIPRASARSYEVKKGEYIQILDVEGRQCSDFMVFGAEELQAGIQLEIDPTTTRSLVGQSFPQPGIFSKFYDRKQRPVLEMVRDTVGRHDTFNLTCTDRYYEELGYVGHVTCTGNFNNQLDKYGIESRQGWSSVNFFYNTAVDAQNQIYFDEPWSRPGDYVMLQAQQDLVCLSSACPCDIDAANGWNPTDIHVRVYPETSDFTRAKIYRMTPDAPAKLTRETGFHSRTSALTRNMVEYKGFWLPASYTKTGVQNEYWACREKAAVIDLSALRKFEVTGPDAEHLMQHTLTRNVRKLSVGQVVYSAMCYDTGGMLDDGTLFKLGEENFRWICGDEYCGVWLREQAQKLGLSVFVKSSTDQMHNISVQGPESRKIVSEIIWTRPDQPTIDELGWFRFAIGRLGGHDGPVVIVSRTGYTGELGYELWVHPTYAPAIWDAVFEVGAPYGVQPCGLDALDLLRVEAGLIFYGFDFCDQTDPFEAGIGFSVALKTKEDDFIGRAALERRKEHPQRKMIGLEIKDQTVVENGDPIFVGRSQVGEVTSSVRSPILRKNIALCRMAVDVAEVGREVEVGKLDGHQKRLPAVTVPFPFYDPDKSRVRS